MTRGDGRLNHDILPGEKGPQDQWRLWGLGTGRGGLQACLLRALRTAAPWSRIGRNRDLNRRKDFGLQGHGFGVSGL